MILKSVDTYIVKIYLAGDIDDIKRACREYCFNVGLCVTVTPTTYIYTGGEELGVEIGLLNYPRFPGTESSILAKAKDLAELCRKITYQHSYLIVTPTETIWNTIRETN
jgi:hypothetical protein